MAAISITVLIRLPAHRQKSSVDHEEISIDHDYSVSVADFEDIGNRVARWAKDLPGPNGFISHTRPPSPARTRSVKKEWSSNKRIDNHLPGSPSGFVSHTRPPPPSESEHSQQVQRLINTTGTGGAHHTRLPKKERRSNKQKPCEQRLHQNNANRGEKRRREVNLKDREHHVDSIAKLSRSLGFGFEVWLTFLLQERIVHSDVWVACQSDRVIQMVYRNDGVMDWHFEIRGPTQVTRRWCTTSPVLSISVPLSLQFALATLSINRIVSPILKLCRSADQRWRRLSREQLSSSPSPPMSRRGRPPMHTTQAAAKRLVNRRGVGSLDHSSEAMSTEPPSTGTIQPFDCRDVLVWANYGSLPEAAQLLLTIRVRHLFCPVSVNMADRLSSQPIEGMGNAYFTYTFASQVSIFRNQPIIPKDNEIDVSTVSNDLFAMATLVEERLAPQPNMLSLRLAVNDCMSRFHIARMSNLADTGDTLVTLLLGSIAVDGLDSRIELDIVELVKIMHRVVRKLRARLGWFRSGLVYDYPEILTPR
ncbi:hypothetical protein FIBSPDRAFT_886894 [Athelia psychrophila]|uniref:Uncharacterized protein n=1 Tax=Athelia psychrophila TaxID=1759441 RepID=A0A166QCH8_9AGAM|nr:hypothetical protein FIBSPDRAFT_886894 [Fibularhizoctonia sp. CBS 109695]